jgi:hypothetical protein
LNEKTKDWELYEAGKKYNNRLEPNYYDTVDANLSFFSGDQWRNVNAKNMPKPVFNIIKRVITFFVASLTTSKVKINFTPLMYSEGLNDPEVERELNVAEIANAQVQNLLEKFKFEFKVKDALFDAAVMGDMGAHMYFDPKKKPYGKRYGDIKGEICFELIDGPNVFFGNANNPRTEDQPYIIISGRAPVEDLREEAKLYKSDEADNIESDVDYNEQAGDAGKIEVEADEYGKALYIIVYRKDKKTGKVKASKSVQNAYIYKDVDTGLNYYPLAWSGWEKQKNQYHHRAVCTGMLPNQIFINRMFAMVMYHLMMTAFPKGVYNADYIDVWNNEIGAAIPVKGIGPEMNIRNIAGYLEPGNMSVQIVQVIELAMQFTKEMLGISDAALGNIDPKNTSATIAVQKSSAIPLENPKSNLYEWIEDIGRILFDMMGTYYGLRPIVMDRQGQKKVEMFDFSVFKDMWLDVKADVGEASYWSEISALQTLDNLLASGHLDIIEYLKRVPDEYIPQKQELISILEERMMQQQQPQAPNLEQLLAQLPPEEQEAFMNAPPEVQQQLLAQIQGA